MADVIKNSFDESNRFTAVLFQRGRDVIDFELNELQDDLRVPFYRSMLNGTCAVFGGVALNPGSNDTGFRVLGTGAANSVTIQVGTLFADGIPLRNTAAFALGGFTTSGVPRTDVVYAAVTEAEVADPAQMPQLGETTRRRQIQITLGISTTGLGGVPANTLTEIWQGGTHYFPIASIARAAAVAAIAAVDVTDLRSLLPPSVISQITRQAGFTVVAVTADLFESTTIATPLVMTFDVDPTGNWTPGDEPRFVWRTRGQAALQNLVEVREMDTATAVAGLAGAVGTLKPLMAFRAVDRVAFSDANTEAGVTPRQVPLSEATDGATRLRIADSPFDPAVAATSLLRAVNGRWTVTCGNGTQSFGDFNGTKAIQNALAFLATLPGARSWRIQLKKGTYDVNAANGSIVIDNAAVVIEGTSRSGVIIRTTDATDPITVQNGAHLTVEMLTLSPPFAAANRIVVNGAGLSMTDVTCAFPILFQNTLRTFGRAYCARLERCSFPGGAAMANGWVKIITSTGAATQDGLVFVECSFGDNLNMPVCRIEPVVASTGQMRVSGVLFLRCQIFTGGTTDSGGGLIAGNCGVLTVEPNGVNPTAGNRLTVTDVTFKDCVVEAGTGAGDTSVLMHLSPTGTNSTGMVTGAEAFVDVNLVTIDGGSWKFQASNSAYAPFTVALNDAQSAFLSATLFSKNKLVIKNVDLGSTSPTVPSAFGPGSYADLRGFFWTVASSANIALDWAAYSMRAYDVEIRNVRCRGMSQNQTNGDFLIAFDGVDIDGLNVFDYVPGGTGSRPTVRVRLGLLERLSAPRRIRGTVRRITLTGKDTGNANEWAATAGASVAAFLMLHGTSGALFQDTPRFTLEACEVMDFTFNGASNANISAIRLHPKILGVQTSSFFNVAVRDCMASHAGIGLHLSCDADGGQARDLLIEGNRMTANRFEGILVDGTGGPLPGINIRGVTLANNYCDLNGTYGIHLNSQEGAMEFEILGNRATGNLAPLAIQIAVRNLLGSVDPRGTILGNFCAAAEAIQVSRAGSVTYDAGAIGYVTHPIRGVETRYMANANLRRCVLLEPLLHNHAVLQTP